MWYESALKLNETTVKVYVWQLVDVSHATTNQPTNCTSTAAYSFSFLHGYIFCIVGWALIVLEVEGIKEQLDDDIVSEIGDWRPEGRGESVHLEVVEPHSGEDHESDAVASG